MKWLTKRHIALYLTILMLAFLVAAFAITKGTPLHKEDTHYLYSGWLTAESRDPENEPYFEKGQTVYQLRMVHELDDTVKGKVLSFRTYDSYVDAWFCDSPDIPADNDSAFYHFGETLRFCDSPGTYTHFLSIPETDAQYLVIRVETAYANKFLTSYDVAIGTENELLYNNLKEDLIPGISNLGMMIFGILLIVIYIIGRCKRIASAESLSLGCLSIAFAVNFNCPLFLNQYLYQNAVVQYYANYFSLFLLPLLVILYFEDIVPKLRMRWMFYGFLLLEAALSVVHFTGIASYTRTIKSFTAALGILAVVSIFLMIRHYREMERFNRISIILLLSFVCGNVIFFIFVSTLGDQTFIIRTGVLLYLALAVVNGIRKLMNEINRERESRLLQEIAYTDKLTKMSNRYALERDARECVLEQTSIVSMDLNLLKTTNDTYGHAGGDVLLQSAAKCMTAVYDKVYRVGGDEFIALLHQKSQNDLEQLHHMLQEQIRKMNADRSDFGEFAKTDTFRLSIAAGYAAYAPGDNSYEQIMSRADEAMYREKKRMHREQKETVRPS